MRNFSSRRYLGCDDDQHAFDAGGRQEVAGEESQSEDHDWGAPVNPEVAEKHGADGYAKDAGTAVDEAIHLLKMLKEEEVKK